MSTPTTPKAVPASTLGMVMENEQRQLEYATHAYNRTLRYREGTKHIFYGSTAMCFLAPLIAVHGFRHADVIRSPVRRWTTNNILCRLANPLCVAGSLSAAWGFFFCPRDYRNWTEAASEVEIARQTMDELRDKVRTAAVAAGASTRPPPEVQ